MSDGLSFSFARFRLSTVTFWFWRFGGVGGLPGLQTGGGRVLFCFIDIAGLCPGKSSVSTNAMIFLALMLRPCVLQARVLV